MIYANNEFSFYKRLKPLVVVWAIKGTCTSLVKGATTINCVDLRWNNNNKHAYMDSGPLFPPSLTASLFFCPKGTAP